MALSSAVAKVYKIEMLKNSTLNVSTEEFIVDLILTHTWGESRSALHGCHSVLSSPVFSN